MNRFARWLCVVSLLVGCSNKSPPLDPGEPSVDPGEVTVGPTSISFGKVFVGSSSAETVVLSNLGRTLASVTVGALPAGYRVQPAWVVLPGSSLVEVTVSFDPTVAGPSRGDVVLNVTGAKNETVTIAVEGEGVAEGLAYDEPLDFGLVEMGTAATLPLRVTSTVDFPLTAALTVVGGNGADVFSVGSSTLELAAGEATDLQITFEPSRRGDLSSFLDVRYCEGCPVSRIRLMGVGGLDSLAAQPVDFGTRPAGSEASMPLAIHNVGDLPVSIASLDLEGSIGFSISDERAVELAPGEVAEYTVVSRAGDELGLRAATVRFRDPDGHHRPEVVPLRATVGGIRIVSEPEVVDFGRQPSGVNARKRIVLQNLGERRVVHLVNPVFEDGSRFTLEPGTPADAEGPGGWKIDTDGQPVSFEIAFESAEVGTYTDALMFLILNADGSLSAEQAEVRVPIVAEAIAGLHCDLEIDPHGVRFGAVRASRAYTKDISVTNVGTDECFVWGVGLDEITANRYFALESLIEGTFILQPGQSLNARVVYSPRVEQSAMDEAYFVFQQPGGEMRTRVTGWSMGFDLVVEPNPITLGTARLGEKIFKPFSIANHGSTAVTIDGLRVNGGDREFFGLDNPSGFAIAGGGTITGHGWFQPTWSGTHASQLEIRVRGVLEPMLVDMWGVGADEPCGVLCEVPIAICPAPITVTVDNTEQVRGSGVSPGGFNVECRWTVLQAPRGSRAQPGTGCRPNFTPDLVGDYVLELRVTQDDDARGWDSCQTTVTARAHGGIWVQMFWDRAGDIDLHVLNEDMGSATNQASWWSSADCHYANQNPTWDDGIPGASPRLDRNDRVGTGPENIEIANPAPHGYAIGFHNMANSRTPVEITTNIFCGGAMIEQITTISSATKEFFVLGSVDDSCRWTPHSTVWTGVR